MAIDATVTDIVQEINDARVDMQSFADFMFKPANVMITRRLAPDTHSLQHYLDYLDAIKLVFTQESGDVTVGDTTIKTVSQLIAEGESSTSAAVENIGTRADTAIGNANTSLNNAIDVILRAGGHVGYPTLAAANADKANITAKTIVEITNDTTANNGVYLYDGTTFTKSSYDLIAQAKTYTDAEILKLANKSSGTFDTLASLTASTLDNDSYALVANDPDLTKNGHYKKVSGTWNKVSYDPVAQAKAYTDLVTPVIKTRVTEGNLITNNVVKITDRGLNNNGTLNTSPSDIMAIVLPVTAGQKLYINRRTDVAGLGGAFSFFVNDPVADTSQSPIPHSAKTFTDAASGIMYYEVTVPNQANYLVLNTDYRDAAFTWAVHLNEFIPSFDLGQESVVSINGKELITGFDLHQLSDLMYSELGHYDRLRESTKNIYDGTVVVGRKVNKYGYKIAPDNYVSTGFIPVQSGETYTISGFDIGLLDRNAYVAAHSTPELDSHTGFWEYLTASGVMTIDIPSDANYIVISLTSEGSNTLQKAKDLLLQVELGSQATDYEPTMYSETTKKMISGLLAVNEVDSDTPTANDAVIDTRVLSQFVELDRVRDTTMSTLGVLEKNITSTGLGYTLRGAADVDSTSNNLFGQIQIEKDGVQDINLHLLSIADSAGAPKLKSKPFTVPSGQFDNPDTLRDYDKTFPDYSYVHPTVAYDSVGVGGFKYWMAASTLPANNLRDATWEDEDIFVSNDGENWQRVQSLYETDKSYTTDTLRLPPHSLVTTNARKHAFLPSPSKGDTIEMSMPVSSRGAAIDRQMITLNGSLPWKHDPAILIDGGYVYMYVTYHLPYAERDGGSNRFVVCVRTDDGINWHVVRGDGSTMLITEESSKKLFTKSDDGKYNYLYYSDGNTNQNPEVIKYGDGDYEFYYGANFSHRYKGTTPYTFDFSTSYKVQEKAASNHPTLLLNAGVLYLVTNTGVHTSTNRGDTFTTLPKYPMWLGGIAGVNYKKSMCIGEGGKLILFDTVRVVAANPFNVVGAITRSNNINLMSIYEYPSINDFIDKAENGFADAYVDVQMTIINHKEETRVLQFYPAFGMTQSTYTVNNPMERVNLTNIDLKAGDVVNFNITLNARKDGSIHFGGIDIT